MWMQKATLFFKVQYEKHHELGHKVWGVEGKQLPSFLLHETAD